VGSIPKTNREVKKKVLLRQSHKRRKKLKESRRGDDADSISPASPSPYSIASRFQRRLVGDDELQEL
jgi:hypothetical protein